MGILGKLKSLFGADAPKQASGILSGVMMGSQMPRRGTRELILAYRRLPWVHTVAHRIAHDVAAVPIELYRGKRDGARKGLATRIKGASGAVRRSLLSDAAARGDLELVDSHPFLDTMARMNPALGSMASRSVTQLYLDLVGECFWVKERNLRDEPVEYWPVPPHWMLDIPTAQTPLFRASYQGWQRSLKERDVLWIRDVDPENPYGRGSGLGTALGDEMDIDEASTKHLKNWFFNNAIPPVIVNLKGLGDEETLRFKERLVQEHRGVDRAHQAFVSNSEEMSVEMLGQTFKDQEISLLRQASRDIVVQVFNVPPEIVGIVENSNRATIDAADFLYSRGVISPRLDFLCSSLQLEADEYDDGLVVGYVSPVPDDREFKRVVMVALPSNFTVDEHRALVGAPALPNGAGDALFEPAMPSAFGAPSLPTSPIPAKRLTAGDPPWALDIATKREESTPNFGQLDNILEALRADRMTSEVMPVWNQALGRWGSKVLTDLAGNQLVFDLKNPLVANHLESFSSNKITGQIDETTRQTLRETLASGMQAGEGINKLQIRVADAFEQADKVRARLIARTEVCNSANFANVTAFKISGVVARKEWLTTRDGRARDTHAALDGAKIPVDADFVTIDGDSGQHPGGFSKAANVCNCFPGETSVSSPFAIGKVYQRRYHGRLVRMLIDGIDAISATPNHPVLTGSGWKAAELVKVGEYVVHVPTQHVQSDNPESGNSVRIEEVFGACSLFGNQHRIPGSGVQFHGDGTGEDVDVVALDWSLGDKLDAALSKDLCKEFLILADTPALRLSPATQLLFGSLHSSDRSMRGFGKLLAFLGSCSGHPDEHRGTAISWLNSCLDKALADGSTRAVESLREFFFADPGSIESREVLARKIYAIGARSSLGCLADRKASLAHMLAENIGASPDGLRGLRESCSFGVEMRRVLDIGTTDFSGHVYNLESEVGWYLAETIVQGNCRCAILPLVDDPGKTIAGLVIRADMTEEERCKTWKRFDRRLLPWEKQATAAFRRGFRAQEADVLAALEAMR